MIYNKKGLTDEQVEINRKKYGTNIINGHSRETFFHLFIETLGDPIIKILLIALGIKLIFLMKDFDWYETIGIVIAIIIASFISTISEYGSAKAFERLQEESSRIKCKVLRNNNIVEIEVEEVVYNDIIILESGDKIPADGIVVKGELSVDESSINGETKEAYKTATKLIDNYNKNNFLYRGTVVYEGNCQMLVTGIGNNTFYGKMAEELIEKTGPSPLKIKLTNLAKLISKIGYVCAILVSISYLFSKIVIQNNFNIDLILGTIKNFPLIFGYILQALTLSVTIIVVAVPEGLPMMITLVLSSNVRRMIKNNVLVRKLVGIETAGSINILFTDKTGTLTKGKLEVIGLITPMLKQVNDLNQINDKNKELIIKNLVYNNESYYDEDINKIIGGNVTDKALLDFVKIKRSNNIKVIENIPFNSKNKYSVSLIEENGIKTKLIKGAPEIILSNCDKYYDNYGNKKILTNSKEIIKEIEKLTSQGIRLLAFAATDNRYNIDNFKHSTFLGLVLIKDEIRQETIESIKMVKEAGIQTVMITGDNQNTAEAIAKQVGLLNNEDDLSITSSQLNNLTDEKLKQILPKLRVISRALPQDKSRLVRISQELDLVVGMTGDGVNDAPALKKADVGFAMGSGTEVSKEASDIIIVDNNFLSITKAILYGRTIFKSIRKFIIFQLTINLCAVSVSIIGPFIGIPVPVTVIQMLWINMVMDTLAGLAFSFEPPLMEYMKEKPKTKYENIINKYMLNEMLITGTYTSILCIYFLKSNFVKSLFRVDINNRYLMTAFFGLFIFSTLFNAFNTRTTRLNIFNNILKNKVFLLIIFFILVVQIYLIYYGGTLFRTSGLLPKELLIMILFAMTVIPVDLIRKIIIKKKNKYVNL